MRKRQNDCAGGEGSFVSSEISRNIECVYVCVCVRKRVYEHKEKMQRQEAPEGITTPSPYQPPTLWLQWRPPLTAPP